MAVNSNLSFSVEKNVSQCYNNLSTLSSLWKVILPSNVYCKFMGKYYKQYCCKDIYLFLGNMCHMYHLSNLTINYFLVLGIACNGFFEITVKKLLTLEDISATSAEQYSSIFKKILNDIPTLFPVFCTVIKLLTK